jgi:hypothetical protein
MTGLDDALVDQSGRDTPIGVILPAEGLAKPRVASASAAGFKVLKKPLTQCLVNHHPHDSRTPEAAMNWQRGRSYCQDLRDKMFAAIDRGMAPAVVAMSFAVSVSWIYKAMGRRRRARRRRERSAVALPCSQQAGPASCGDRRAGSVGA